MLRKFEVGQGRWWGCGPEQLLAKVPHGRVYSGCIIMASFWPCSCSVNIAPGAPGALYLNILCIYLYIGAGRGFLRRWSPTASVPRGGGAPAAGLRRETIAGNNPFLLHVAVHVLQGVKAKVPFPQFLSQFQNGYPNNKEVYNICLTVCLFTHTRTHTHVALARS